MLGLTTIFPKAKVCQWRRRAAEWERHGGASGGADLSHGRPRVACVLLAVLPLDSPAATSGSLREVRIRSARHNRMLS